MVAKIDLKTIEPALARCKTHAHRLRHREDGSNSGCSNASSRFRRYSSRTVTPSEARRVSHVGKTVAGDIIADDVVRQVNIAFGGINSVRSACRKMPTHQPIVQTRFRRTGAYRGHPPICSSGRHLASASRIGWASSFLMHGRDGRSVRFFRHHEWPRDTPRNEFRGEDPIKWKRQPGHGDQANDPSDGGLRRTDVDGVHETQTQTRSARQ